MKTEERIARLDWWDRAEVWLEFHNVALYADLTTYYFVCCLFGFLQGLLLGTLMVRSGWI